MKKRGQIDWGKISTAGVIVVILFWVVLMGLVVLGGSQNRADYQNQLQTVYPIYEDDHAVCYRITAGADTDGVFHKETQQCVAK